MASKRELLNGVVNRINLVGIELEGGWNRCPDKKLGHFDHDGSVRFEPFDKDGDRMPMPQYYTGEYVSYPMPVDQIASWLRTTYPEHVNGTCGLHIHMSFHNKLNYSRLMVAEYMETMIAEIRRFAEQEELPADHALWRRLDPADPWTTRYCAHQFLADHQVLVKKKHDYHGLGTSRSRYTFINYPDAQQHTVECRGLSMFGDRPTTTDDVEMAIRAVMVVLNTTNRFLSKIRQRERSHIVEVIGKPAVTQEIGSVIR